MCILAQTGGDEDEENEDSEGKSSLHLLQEILTSLTARIIEADMEDFELVNHFSLKLE